MTDLRLSWATSADGTQIAYWTSGSGRPLVLVHGAGSLHSTWNTVRPHLEPHVTVHALDRRGRGASEDAPIYDVVREYEDICAVVNAVAEASGSRVDLLGHSFGGMCSLAATQLTSNVGRLLLYEGWPSAEPGRAITPDGFIERMGGLLAEGRSEVALEVFYREVAGMTETELSALREIPGWWEARLALAHTIPRELRADQQSHLAPGDLAAFRVPTLLLVGGDSPAHLTAGCVALAAALPDARVSVLPGQGHVAHQLAPELFAAEVLAFVGTARRG